MSNSAPIGVLDSGVGGLSITKEIRVALPNENILYFADSAYCPYGEKPPEQIKDRVFTLCQFLLDQGAKIIVMACNTASIVSLDAIRSHYSVPVIGVEPAVKAAVLATKTGTIGVLATGVTLSGDRFASLVRRFCTKTKVVTQPCPGLVELVENGCISGPKAEKMLTEYLKPLLAQNTDTIVLGCTHYPFLKPLIEKILKKDITIIDTGHAVARQTAKVLRQFNLLNDEKAPGSERFFTSGNREIVSPVIKLLWYDQYLEVEHPIL